MKPYWSILVLVLVSILLTACPAQPTKHSDPDEAKSRSDRSMQELDRETR